jgi:hypothetical protein
MSSFGVMNLIIIHLWMSPLYIAKIFAFTNCKNIINVATMLQQNIQDASIMYIVATPLWGKCEVATHTPKNGTWESSGIPENSECDCRGQNTSPGGVFYIFEKVLKCRCLKWPHISHLDIYITSYGQKKGWESNCQFDSWPLKVGNRPGLGVCRQSVTHRWKALEESYNFSSDLVPIWSRGEKLWPSEVPGVKTGTISGLHFESRESQEKEPFGCRCGREL